MKVIDCFPFFNELDLLEIRLNELKDVVDVFVLTEAPHTFTGKDKPLFFAENKDRFKDFNIVHTVFEDRSGNHAMEREHKQKQYNLDKAYEIYEQGDVIMFSDCDEIPKANVVKEAIKLDGSTGLILKTCYYYLNCQEVGNNSRWPSVVLIRPSEKPVYNVYRKNQTDRLIHNAGHHFSYLGDISYKLASWGHADQFDKPPYNDPGHIERHKASGKDFLMRRGSRKIDFEFTDDLSCLPQHVMDNLDRYGQWIKR